MSLTALLLTAAFLGAVQGVTEFLPVSSTAHLIILPQLLGWSHPLLNNLTFNVMLHLGTLVALLIVFRGEWRRLGGAFAAPRSSEGRLAWGLAAATAPALLCGWLFKSAVSTHLRNPLSVACWLAVGAVALWWADRRRQGDRTAQSLSLMHAMLIGCAQALALLPGFSRSGATITAGLLLGLSRQEAARYSFLLSAPIIAAACLYEALSGLPDLPPSQWAPVAAGVLVSGLVGAVCIRWFLRAVPWLGFAPFISYRLFLAAVIGLWAR